MGRKGAKTKVKGQGATAEQAMVAAVNTNHLHPMGPTNRQWFCVCAK